MAHEEKAVPTLLFVTNGDGTVDCSWCGKTFNVDDAVPDEGDDPVCQKCAESCDE